MSPPYSTEAEIWTCIISADVGDLTPEVTSEWLRLKLADDGSERVKEFNPKASAGDLSVEEARLLESYHAVAFVIDLLKAKARLSLQRRNSERKAR